MQKFELSFHDTTVKEIIDGYSLQEAIPGIVYFILPDVSHQLQQAQEATGIATIVYDVATLRKNLDRPPFDIKRKPPTFGF